MVSQTSESAVRRRSLGHPLDDLAPVLALALVAVQALIALVLLERRVAGVLVDPGGVALIAAGLLIVALAAAPRGIARAMHRTACPTWFNSVVWLTPSLAIGFAVISLSAGGSASWAVAAVWLAAIVEEAWSWTLLRPGGALGGRFRRKSSTSPEAPLGRAEILAPRRSLGQTAAPRVAADPIDPHVWQQTSRGYEDDGADVLRGRLRAYLQAGQRTAHVHLAFCPPFARLPRFDYRQLEGPGARVKLGQLLPYGVRLDVKLDAPAEAPTTVLLELTAREEVERIGGTS